MAQIFWGSSSQIVEQDIKHGIYNFNDSIVLYCWPYYCWIYRAYLLPYQNCIDNSITLQSSNIYSGIRFFSIGSSVWHGLFIMWLAPIWFKNLFAIFRSMRLWIVFYLDIYCWLLNFIMHRLHAFHINIHFNDFPLILIAFFCLHANIQRILKIISIISWSAKCTNHKKYYTENLQCQMLVFIAGVCVYVCVILPWKVDKY